MSIATAVPLPPPALSSSDTVAQAIVQEVRQTLGLSPSNNDTMPTRLLRGAPAWKMFPAAPSMMAGSSDASPQKTKTKTKKKKQEVQLGCAWSATVTAATYNVAFPDLNCVYQVLIYWGVTGSTTLRIDGHFPRVRYFSFQSYDLQDGAPIASLIDYELEASSGTNPFQNEPASDDPSSFGRYQVHITDSGDHGMPNELAATSGAGKQRRQNCGAKGCVALVILRLYTAEPGNDAFHHAALAERPDIGGSRLWGYVPPPEVSVRYGSWVNAWTGKTIERYKVLEQCQSDKSTVVKSFLDWKIPQLKGDWEGQSQLDNVDDNFVVYTPSSSSRALFANADASYLFATARNNRTTTQADSSSGGRPQTKQLVARITGRLPTVAHGFTNHHGQATNDFHAIADRHSYEARYVSLSTIALKGAGPVIDTVMDTVIEDKHRRQHEEWERTRQFSVVAAPGSGLLARCPPRVYKEDRDLFLTTIQPGEREPPAHVAFLYRQILSQWQTFGYRDQSIARAKYECLGRNDGGHACKLRSFFVDLMGPQYPSITYFYCWQNATQGCSCEDTQGRMVEWDVDEAHEDEDEEEEWWHGHHSHHHGHGFWDDEDEGEDDPFLRLDFMTGNSTLSPTGANTTTTAASDTVPPNATLPVVHASSLSRRVPPYAWNQTQAYYYYTSLQQQRQQEELNRQADAPREVVYKKHELGEEEGQKEGFEKKPGHSRRLTDYHHKRDAKAT